jgi:hypothetical protein
MRFYSIGHGRAPQSGEERMVAHPLVHQQLDQVDGSEHVRVRDSFHSAVVQSGFGSSQ